MIKSKTEISKDYKFLKTIHSKLSAEQVPTLIPEKKMQRLMNGDESPCFKVEEIVDISQPVFPTMNMYSPVGVTFTPEFWDSYIGKLNQRPFPGSKRGHSGLFDSGTPSTDVYTVGGKREGNKVWLKIYIPKMGGESSNESLIRDADVGIVHFSIVSKTKDMISVDENGQITEFKAIQSITGERNDIVEFEQGAMDQIVAKGKYNISPDTDNGFKFAPYPNEHAARVRDPGDFEKGSFRRKKLPKSEGGKGGISIIIGRLKGETKTTTQAYRFDAKLYTVAEAKKWLKDNDVKYISFEPATGSKEQSSRRYIMPENTYKEIIENLKNQMTNGAVSIVKLAADLGFRIVTEQIEASLGELAEIKKLAGEKPVEAIRAMKANEDAVALEKYTNTRNRLMRDAFGDECDENLVRAAADPHVSKTTIDEKALTAQIEKAKSDPVVMALSKEKADITSGVNLMTGEKKNGNDKEIIVDI